MAARPSLLLVLTGAFLSLGASYRTPNFVVQAPTPEIAQQVGQYAEHYRREKAILWLGQEMRTWGQPCPLRVQVTMQGAGGATSFAFDQGYILSQDMHIEGSLDRLLASVLPHEITHTVFAHYFRTPVPRWADEGGSVLSEDKQERDRHDHMVRNILNTPGRAIPLRRLFNLRDYPNDVMVLYAEGFSVTDFLVAQSSRSVFLAFVAQGMRGDWDEAVRTHYRYKSVEELEKAWLQRLRDTRRQPQQLLASGHGRPEGAHHVVVRQTLPPAQPLLEAPRPIVRGSAPDEPRAATPGYPPPPRFPNGDAATSSGVRLGAPQFDPAPPPPPPAQPVLGMPVPRSPVGFSR